MSVMNRTYADFGGMILGIGMAVFCAVSPKASAHGITPVARGPSQTAQGFATPYLLKATNPGNEPCHQADSSQSAFVQGAITDPDTGQISIYAPLVIDEGTEPAVAPVVPVLPPHYVAALWFGFDPNNLKQGEAVTGTLASNTCVNGFVGPLFTQFSCYNAVNSFAAANKAIADKLLVVPPPGTGADGYTCPRYAPLAWSTTGGRQKCSLKVERP